MPPRIPSKATRPAPRKRAPTPVDTIAPNTPANTLILPIAIAILAIFKAN